MTPTALQAIFRSSGDILADRRFAYARDLEERGDLAAAADVMAQAVELAPKFTSAWFALGVLRERLDDRGGAIAAFSAARAADLSDEIGAGLRLARLGAADPAVMPPAYVRALFDQYAPRFDKALLSSLHYRGHLLLAEAIRVVEGPGRRFSAALDLGCGTGLAAEALQGSVGAFTGVDISPVMIEHARRKNIYESLVVADITDFLRLAPAASFDLVVSADALVYIPDLDSASCHITRVLKPDGLFAFTVETHDGDGVILGEKLRYAHGSRSVRDAVIDAGLTIRAFDAVSTRCEAEAPVPGLLCVASSVHS